MSPSSVTTDTECPLHLPMEMQPDEVVLASTHASDEPGTEMSPPCALTRSPQYRSGMCATISALLDDCSRSWTSEYQKHVTNMVNAGWFQRRLPRRSSSCGCTAISSWLGSVPYSACLQLRTLRNDLLAQVLYTPHVASMEIHA